MAITVTLEVHFAPDNIDGAPDSLRAILKDTRAFSGCLSVEVVHDLADPAHYLLIELWESLEHDQAYRAWRAGDGATNLNTLVDRPSVLTKFESRADI